LSSGETRESFDGRTKRFNIITDGEFDNQEDRENLEEASSIVSELFECVKDMVQYTRIMQKEEEVRLKQARFNRSRMAFGPIPTPIPTDQGLIHQGESIPTDHGTTRQGGLRTDTTGHGIRRSERMEINKGHETDLQKKCRDCRDKVEDITRKSLGSNIMTENLNEKDRQMKYINHMEDATRYQQRMMMILTR
jgi:hypothetical protein